MWRVQVDKPSLERRARVAITAVIKPHADLGKEKQSGSGIVAMTCTHKNMLRVPAITLENKLPEDLSRRVLQVYCV
jgi:hypothetical protein